MKLSLILVAALALVGCADEPEDNQAPQVKLDDHIPSPGGGGGYYSPCGITYHLRVVTDAGVWEKDVPVYCNPNADEYYGDPPDYKSRINPNPEENFVLPSYQDKL